MIFHNRVKKWNQGISIKTSVQVALHEIDELVKLKSLLIILTVIFSGRIQDQDRINLVCSFRKEHLQRWNIQYWPNFFLWKERIDQIFKIISLNSHFLVLTRSVYLFQKMSDDPLVPRWKSVEKAFHNVQPKIQRVPACDDLYIDGCVAWLLSQPF